MNSRTDHEYFKWLVSQINVLGSNSYDDLFQRMHDTEFVWTIPNDDNRIQDARDLRDEFGSGARRLERPISLLEVLIVVSRQAAFIAGGDPEYWAWQLIENLRLNKASDPLIGAKANRVEDVLHALVWRTYERDGRGGFFPLSEPHEDQTKVEIWYQLNAYVNEIIE